MSNFARDTANTAAVPEPASWAPMLIGLGSVGGLVRARRTSARLAALRA